MFCNGIHWVTRDCTITYALNIEVIVAINKNCSAIDIPQNKCHAE
jgi:hypothetical protein